MSTPKIISKEEALAELIKRTKNQAIHLYRCQNMKHEITCPIDGCELTWVEDDLYKYVCEEHGHKWKLEKDL